MMSHLGHVEVTALRINTTIVMRLTSEQYRAQAVVVLRPLPLLEEIQTFSVVPALAQEAEQ